MDTEPANARDDQEMGLVVGGTTPWYQDPENVTCPKCGASMIYVAAMCSVNDFNTFIPISEAGGYQYLFACDYCHALSVVPQWS